VPSLLGGGVASVKLEDVLWKCLREVSFDAIYCDGRMCDVNLLGVDIFRMESCCDRTGAMLMDVADVLRRQAPRAIVFNLQAMMLIL
jgi:hypothetical protein